MAMIKNILTSFYNIRLTTALFLSMIVIVYMLTHVSNAMEYFYLLKNSANPGMTFTPDRFRFLLHSSVKQDIVDFTSPDPAESSTIPTFHLYVDKKDIARLDANLPESGRSQYVTAYMKTDESDRRRRVEMRYRGDSHYHWLYRKKSLRIKLEKGDLYNMERKFNLINLTSLFMTNEMVNYEVARELGLMSPEFYPVRLFINDKYSGLYMYLSQVDESLLRKHKRMPGSIYYGEKPLLNIDFESLLWKDEKQWGKRASRSMEKEADRSDIAYLIKAINEFTDQEFYDFANTFLDKDKFYSFFALDNYFGSYHHDYFHNHKLYFDPYLGKFEPFAWDLRFWSNTHAKDTSFYTLLERIKRNPVLEYERDLHAYRLMKSHPVESVNQRFSAHNALVYEDLSADNNRDTAEYTAPFNNGSALPFYMKQFDASVRFLQDNLVSRHRFLEKTFNDITASYKTEKIGRDTLLVTFRVSGNNPVRVDLGKHFAGKKPVTIHRSRHYRQGQGTIAAVEGMELLYPGRMYVEGNAIGHRGYALFGEKMLIDAPLYYSYIIKGEQLVDTDTITVTNAITGNEHSIERRKFNLSDWSDSMHPWDIRQEEEKSVTLAGNIQIDKTRVYPAGTSVLIKPGTRFSLAAGASLVFHGRVQAMGTHDKPVVFKAADELPWGSLIVQGQHSAGSRFEHVHISGGSIATHNLINYPGQFNIHDTRDFAVAHCYLAENKIGDDNMHVAYSNGTIDNCTFVRSNSDALDVDISTVRISNSLFLDSGNDALDFMTSQADVVDNLFVRTGDKCISTGEWSTGRFHHNVMTQCHIGIEVKDKSEVELTDSIIFASKSMDINLYNKNYRYDAGGSIKANNIYLPDNAPVKADDRSRHELVGVNYNYPPMELFGQINLHYPAIGSWQEIGLMQAGDEVNKP